MERLLLLVIGAFSGIALSLVLQVSAEGENGAATKPVYVVVSAEIHEPDQLGPYAEAARPLALAAGLEVLAGLCGVALQHVGHHGYPVFAEVVQLGEQVLHFHLLVHVLEHTITAALCTHADPYRTRRRHQWIVVSVVWYLVCGPSYVLPCPLQVLDVAFGLQFRQR